MKISDKILYLRKKNKYSQKKLASMVNVTRQTISNWETGKSIPDIYQSMALAKAFNTDLNEFVKSTSQEAEEWNQYH